jgi:hypothetical protein
MAGLKHYLNTAKHNEAELVDQTELKITCPVRPRPLTGHPILRVSAALETSYSI